MSQYIRHSVIEINLALDLIKSKQNQFNGVLIRTGGLRIKTFIEKQYCVYCGNKATHFALEKQSEETEKYHLNMYGYLNDEEMLFTHDHIHARSLGGRDNLNNSVTACYNCNNRKATFENKIIRNFKKKNIRLMNY